MTRAPTRLAASRAGRSARRVRRAGRRARGATPPTRRGRCDVAHPASPRTASIRRRSYDTYSDAVCSAIFDPLYRYDYSRGRCGWCRTPRTRLPEITDGGRTYTIKVKPGIYFADDPAFNGKRAS